VAIRTIALVALVSLQLLPAGCKKAAPAAEEEENELITSSGCGTERWAVKTGTDSAAGSVTHVPTDTAIATMIAYARPSPPATTNRVAPEETTMWRLTNVTLTGFKLEQDSDVHLVISDGTHTMIAEIPAPNCVSSGPFQAAIQKARTTFTAKYTPGSMTTVHDTVSLIGVGFFDNPHGQTGVAPNAIELHPVLGICFGANCDPGGGPASTDGGVPSDAGDAGRTPQR
jgi:hypothetical protein